MIFDLDNAVFVPVIQCHAHCLSAETSRYLHLHLLLQIQLSDIDCIDITSNDLKSLLRAVLNFYVLHSQGFTELKSLSVFEDLNDL